MAKLDVALGRLGRRIKPDGSIGGSASADVNCCECTFAFADGYLELELTPVAPDDDFCGLSNRRHRDHVDQMVEIDDVDPAESENDVARREARLVRPASPGRRR